MLKGDWRTAVIAGLILVGTFAVGGFVLGNQLGHQEGQRYAKTQEYAHEAAQQIENTCVGIGGRAELECIVDIVEATNGHERAENDLIAQQDMGRWALYMLLATVVMAVITAFGVYYVWRTLVATQEMVRDTRDIGKNQTRPWVLIDRIEYLGVPKGQTMQAVRVFIRNYGNSPAIDVEINSAVTIATSNGFSTELPVPDAPPNPSRSTIPPGGETFTTTNFDLDNEHVALLEDGVLSVFALGNITYRDVFGSDRWTRYQQVRGMRSIANGLNFVSCEKGNYQS